MKGTVRRRCATSAASSSVSSSSYSVRMSRGKRRCSQRSVSSGSSKPRSRARSCQRLLLLGLIQHPQLEYGAGGKARAQVRQRPCSSAGGACGGKRRDAPPRSSSSRSSPNNSRSQSSCPPPASTSSRHRHSSCGSPSSTPPRARELVRAARTRSACARWPRAHGLQQVSLARAGRPAQPGESRCRRRARRLQMLDRLALRAGRKACEHRAIGKSNTERKLLHALSPQARRAPARPGAPREGARGSASRTAGARQHDQASASSTSTRRECAAAGVEQHQHDIQQLRAGVDLADARSAARAAARTTARKTQCAQPDHDIARDRGRRQPPGDEIAATRPRRTRMISSSLSASGSRNFPSSEVQLKRLAR